MNISVDEPYAKIYLIQAQLVLVKPDFTTRTGVHVLLNLLLIDVVQLHKTDVIIIVVYTNTVEVLESVVIEHVQVHHVILYNNKTAQRAIRNILRY